MDLKLSFVILNWASESPVSRHIYQGGFPGVFWAFLLIEWKFVRDQERLTGQRACCVRYECNRDEIYKLKCIIWYVVSSVKRSDECWAQGIGDRSAEFPLPGFPFCRAGVGFPIPSLFWDVHSPSSQLILSPWAMAEWEKLISLVWMDGWMERKEGEGEKMSNKTGFSCSLWAVQGIKQA